MKGLVKAKTWWEEESLASGGMPREGCHGQSNKPSNDICSSFLNSYKQSKMGCISAGEEHAAVAKTQDDESLAWSFSCVNGEQRLYLRTCLHKHLVHLRLGCKSSLH